MLAIIALSVALSATPEGYLNTTWGMTPREVQAVGHKCKLKGELCSYQGNIANLPALLGFNFLDGKLGGIMAIYETQHPNANTYAEIYAKLKGLLYQKYGQPIEDQERWDKPTYQDMPTHLGIALKLEQVSFDATWATEQSTISIVLASKDMHPFIRITYLSKEASAAWRAQRQASALGGL